MAYLLGCFGFSPDTLGGAGHLVFRLGWPDPLCDGLMSLLVENAILAWPEGNQFVDSPRCSGLVTPQAKLSPSHPCVRTISS